ncbi:hypothetical protein F4225_01505 [Candidatus Poribacteria bacterium]|nr:hypothetical protein [Candidatus Poribacteria bacterium]
MNAIRELDGSLCLRVTYDDENVPPIEMWRQRIIEHIRNSTRDYGSEYRNGGVRIQVLNITIDIGEIPEIEEE